VTYSCPNCRRDDGLWEAVEVPGWRSIDAHGNPTRLQREVDWSYAEPTAEVGCAECSWEGLRSELLRDGVPLPSVHPRQQRLPS